MFMKKLQLTLSILLLGLGACNKEPEAVVYNDYVEPYELVEETFRLGARSTAAFSNKSIITRSFTLPPRTVYWAYWMGAGPEPVAELAKVAIPPVVGLTEAEASELLRNKGFRDIRVEYLDLPSGSTDIGRVISQDPSSGVEVAPGSPVLLKVGRASATTTTTSTTTTTPPP